MQYIKCQKCVHNNAHCRCIMAKAMSTLWNIQDLINSSQTRKGGACQLQIDYKCIAFQPKETEVEENGEV